jgi:hypothetical protein
MTPERRKELEMNIESELTEEEVREGWVFCCEWDGLLIHKSDKEAECCYCLKEREREKKQ